MPSLSFMIPEKTSLGMTMVVFVVKKLRRCAKNDHVHSRVQLS